MIDFRCSMLARNMASWPVSNYLNAGESGADGQRKPHWAPSERSNRKGFNQHLQHEQKQWEKLASDRQTGIKTDGRLPSAMHVSPSPALPPF